MTPADPARAAALLKKSRTLGFALLLCVAIIWIISSFISGALVAGTDTGTAAVPPFLLTYAASSLFTIYLPLIHLRELLRRAWGSDKRQRGWLSLCAGFRTKTAQLVLGASPSTSWQAVPGASSEGAQPAAADGAAVLQDAVAFRAALWATPLWFLAQYTFNVSLAYTSVTSNTIISATSSLFTYGLSIVYLDEHHSTAKLVGICGCIAGTALVTLSDSGAGSGSGNKGVIGDVLCIVSAAVYGAYTVMMRKKLPGGDDTPATVALFFGYVGLLTTVVLAPVIGILLATGGLSVANIPRRVVGLILLEGALDYVLADYLWARSVMLLGPTLATLGLSVQIPLAAAAELVVGHPAWVHKAATIVMTVGGTALILAGFFVVNADGGAEAAGSESGKRKESGGGARRDSSGDSDGEGGGGAGDESRALLQLSTSGRASEEPLGGSSRSGGYVPLEAPGSRDTTSPHGMEAAERGAPVCASGLHLALELAVPPASARVSSESGGGGSGVGGGHHDGGVRRTATAAVGDGHSPAGDATV